MSFLNEVKTGNKSIISNAKKSGFLSGISFQTPEQQKIQTLRESASQLEAQANKGLLSNMLSSAKDIVTKSFGTALDASTATFTNLFQAGPKLGEAIKQGPGQTIAANIDAAISIAGVAFLPFSAASAAASQIPILKQANDVLNTIFEAIGVPGKFFGETFAKAIPESLLGKEGKDALIKAFGDLGSLGTQVYVGGKIMESFGKGEKVDKAKIDEIKTEAENLPPEVKKLTIKDLTPKEIQINPRTPYIPENQLPTIQARTTKSELPTIQVGEPTLSERLAQGKTERQGGLTYEPIKPEPVITSPYQPRKGSFLDLTKMETKPPTLAEQVSGEGKPAKAALDINQKLVEKGFDELPKEAMASYDPATKAEVMRKVTDKLNSDPKGSEKIATGERPSDLPANETQVLYNAIKNKAILENNYDLMRKLADSPIATARSIAAQTLGAAGFNNDPFGPVERIREVQKARENATAKKVGKGKTFEEVQTQELKKASEAGKTEAKSNLSKRQTWESFIEEIKCNF